MDMTEFFTIWRQFQGKGHEENVPLCPIAAEFLKKLEETLFAPLAQGVSRAKIAQAKYMLQEEYHAWKKSVPARHLRAAADHHRCVTDAYDAAYDRLHLIDLTLRPALNLILEYDEIAKPQPQPPTPPPEPAYRPMPPALYFGDVEEFGG